MNINDIMDSLFVNVCKVNFKDAQHKESLQEVIEQLRSQYKILPLLLPVLKKESIEIFSIPISKNEIFYQWCTKHKLQCEDVYFKEVPASNVRVISQNRKIRIFLECCSPYEFSF